ncbi:MAG: MFS transporter, partial [Planctomycetota bacterium]
MQRLIAFLGINKSIGVMVAVVIFVGLGEKMAERFLPIYLLALGGSTFSVGFLNALDNFLSALYSFPGGYLSHKIGYKKALILFTLVSMFGYAIVIIIPRWEAVLIGAIFFIAWTAVSLPAIMSLIATTMRKDKRTMGVSVHSFVRRIPMALGPVLGGLFIGWYGEVNGIKIAFAAAFVLGLIAIVLIRYLMEDDFTNNNAKDIRFSAVIRKFNPSLVNLLISDILIRFAEQIPYAFVVIWVIKNNNVSPFEFGLLTVVEMVTAMLVYIPVAYYADRHTKKPFVLITFVFFTIFPLILCYSKTFPILVVAF